MTNQTVVLSIIDIMHGVDILLDQANLEGRSPSRLLSKPLVEKLTDSIAHFTQHSKYRSSSLDFLVMKAITERLVNHSYIYTVLSDLPQQSYDLLTKIQAIEVPHDGDVILKVRIKPLLRWFNNIIKPQVLVKDLSINYDLEVILKTIKRVYKSRKKIKTGKSHFDLRHYKTPDAKHESFAIDLTALNLEVKKMLENLQSIAKDGILITVESINSTCYLTITTYIQ